MIARKNPIATALGTDLIAPVIQSRVRMPRQFKQSIRSEKWQTYLFVRNQMVLILLRVPSTSMTQPVIRSTPIIGPRSLCAGAELRRTSLSATAPTARSAFKRPKQSTRKAPNNIGGINAVQVFFTVTLIALPGAVMFDSPAA